MAGAPLESPNMAGASVEARTRWTHCGDWKAQCMVTRKGCCALRISRSVLVASTCHIRSGRRERAVRVGPEG
eukprot:3345473-Prymnesium_polylepis.1